jgi:hypothetical protein
MVLVAKSRHRARSALNPPLFPDLAAKPLEHAQSVRIYSGEEPKCLRGLKHGHSTAIQRATTERTSQFQQLRFEWEVNNFRDP